MSILIKNMFFDHLPKEFELGLERIKNIRDLQKYISNNYNIQVDQYIFLVNGHKPRDTQILKDGDEVLIMVLIFGS